MAIGIKVPEVDFGWLAQLPQQFEEAQNKRERKRTLSDLDINDSDSLIQAGRRVLPYDPKLGLGLLELANKRRGLDLEERSGNVIQGIIGGGQMAPQPPAASGPRPGGPVMPSATNWGDAEAEAAGLYEPRQVAQAPEPPAGDPAPQSLPSTIDGIQLTPRMRQLQLGMAYSKKPGQQQAMKLEFDTLLEEQKSRRDAAQKMREKSFESQLRLDEVGPQESTKAAWKDYGKIREERQSSEDILNTVTSMKNTLDDPNFISGAGASGAKAVGSFILTAGQVAKNAGAPQEWVDRLLSGVRSPVAAMEAFSSQSNNLVLSATGGSLGRQISDADRNFYTATYANLGASREGNKRIMEFLELAHGLKIERAQRAAEYMRKRGATAEGLDEVMTKFGKEARDTLKKRAEADREALGRSEKPAAAPAKSGARPAPNEEAIKALRADPSKAQEFDAFYGPNASSRYLGRMGL